MILIFHPKPTVSNSNMTGINGASHEFLSNPKPGNSNQFENYQAPPHLLTQVSNISSDYDYDTKESVVVPMTEGVQQQESLGYASRTAYSLPPPPPPPPSGPAPSDPLPQEPTTYYQRSYEQPAPPVFTPSTATLVSQHLPSDTKTTSQSSGGSLARVSESNGTPGGAERDWSQDWATQQHQHMPLPPPPPPVIPRQQSSFEQASDMDERVGATPPECVRRQRTDDSQWLNQCPRTSTRYS